MKGIVQRGLDRFFSDCSTTARTIEAKFNTTHHLQLQKNPNWSIAATRQLLITNYWFAELKSFLLILVLFIAGTTVLAGTLNVYKLTADALLLTILFFTFHFFLFRPKFYSEFLPILENKTALSQNEQQQALIARLEKQLAEQQEKATNRYEQLRVEEQEKRELQEANILKREKLIATEKAEIVALKDSINKCRKTQYHTFTIALIYHVICKSLFRQELKSDNDSTEVLNKLFGIDAKSLRNPIDIINGVSSKRAKIEGKKITVTEQDFNEARFFFQSVNYQPGIHELDSLENTIRQSSKKFQK